MEAADRSSGISHSDDGVRVQRLEVLEGPSGRRRWPDAVKGRIVAESYASDSSVSATARRHGLVPSQLFAWRREAKAGRLIMPGDDAGAFAPLLLEADAPASPPTSSSCEGVGIAVGSVTVWVPAETAPKRIAAIAAALVAAL